MWGGQADASLEISAFAIKPVEVVHDLLRIRIDVQTKVGLIHRRGNCRRSREYDRDFRIAHSEFYLKADRFMIVFEFCFIGDL